MSFGPKDSKITLNEEQTKHLGTLITNSEISAFMRQLAEEQNLVQHLDGYPQEVLVDVPKKERKTATITLDGQTYEFSADTDEELLKVQADFMRGRSNGTTVAPVTKTVAPKTEPARDNTGKFVAQKDTALAAADKAMLELKWKRGEVSTPDYLAQSGVMDEYIGKLQERAEASEVQSWANATTQFVKNNPDWPGGEANRDRLGNALKELHLENATDRLQALQQAYDAMKRGDAFTSMNAELAKAKSKGEIEAIRAKYAPTLGVGTNAGGVNGGSGYWGGH